MDKRIVKTHAAILKAYSELIIKKEPAKITVSDIARQANIDRKTFYLHYAMPSDVLDELINDRFRAMLELLEKKKFFEDPFNAEYLIEILDGFYKEEEEILKKLANSDSYDSVLKRMHEILSDKIVELYEPNVDLSEADLKVYFDFYASGVIDIYRRWVRGEYDYDLKRLTEMVSNIGLYGISTHFRTTSL